MIKKILVVLLAVVLVIASVAAFQPNTFTVNRTATIDAPAAKVFAHVNDLHAWDAWSPWAKLDPKATATFEGPKSGVGSSMAWKGDDKVGEGKMTVVESTPASLIKIKTEFFKPWEAVNDTQFTFTPKGKQTRSHMVDVG